jgi:hypothetical protein
MIPILILYVGLLGTRTIGVLSKVDQAAGEKKALSAVQALLVNQGPRIAADIQWVATIGHSVAIASVQAEIGSETSAETSRRAECDSLISVLGGAPQSKLGREALIDSLAKQMRTRIQVRLPNLLNRYKLVLPLAVSFSSCIYTHPTFHIIAVFKGSLKLFRRS